MSEITVPHVEAPYPFEAYAHVVEPLTEDDGGGYPISFPDLPGCMSDGETAEPVRLMQRLPRSLHASLVARAKVEGTSMNTLVTILLAEGIGRRNHRAWQCGDTGFPATAHAT